MTRCNPRGLAISLLLMGSSLDVGSTGSRTHEEVLGNGLRVILIPHRANPMVASSVVVGAGVIHEPEGMNGASHFLEHLLFNGTARRTQRELYDEVDRYGAYNNATTREDHTLFTLLIQKEFAEQGLDLQADMLFHSTLPPDKFDKEKGIVLEELAKDRNDPAYLAREAFRAFAYAGTPLGRAVLGSEASIGALRREDVYAYYKSRYVPANMVLVVMGDFEPPAMMTKIRRIFGAAPGGEPPPRLAGSWPAPPEKNLSTRPLEAGRTYVHAAVPLALAPWDPEMAALELLVSALADGDEAPLRRVLSSGADPLTLSFTLALEPRSAPWSTLELEAVLPKGRDAVMVLDKAVAALGSSEVLEAARERVETVRSAARADEVRGADQIHYYVLMRSAVLLGSPTGYLSHRLETLNGIGEEALRRAEAWLPGALTSLRAAVMGPELPNATRAFRPAPGPAREGPAPSSGPKRVREVLPSGLDVQVERNDDSRVFAAHLLLWPRSLSEPEGKEGIADFLHRLFLRGTLVHDRAALAARLQDTGAAVKTSDDPTVPFDDYYSTPEFSFVRLEMPADHWREGMALLGEMVLFPRFDRDEIEAVRTEMLDLQRRRAESTRGTAEDLMAQTLLSDHPLARPVLGTPASIASITEEDLRAFREAYVTGRRMILTVVGPVAPAEALDTVRSAFGTLRAGEAPAVPRAPLTPPGRTATKSLGKEQASIGLAYLFEAEPADEAALEVAGALLSDRLSFHLREERGLAYSLSASIAPWGGRMRFEVTMATRQENVDRALEGLREEIAAFPRGEPDAAAVVRAANRLRGRLLMRRLTRINQAYFAGLERREGRPPGDDLARLAALLKVEAKDVRRVARKYVDAARCATAIVR